MPERRHHRQADAPARRAGPTPKRADAAARGTDRGARAGMPRFLQAASLDAPRPLDARTRASMEARLGMDLRRVRVHTGPESSAATLALGANAFTIARDVVFAEGRYAPETHAGRRLLRHELTHVAQQHAARDGRAEEVSTPGDPSEREADRVAHTPGGARETPRERTPIRVARDPATATAATREGLEKSYQIRIIKGDKPWSESDLADLAAALGKLSPTERAIVAGYDFQRWTTPARRAELDRAYKPPPGVEECGFHELTLGGTMAKISMYDGCFDPSTTMAGAPVARFNILHEIGHAAESSRARAARKTLDAAQASYDAAYSAADAANQAYNAANDERNALVRQYDAADAAGKRALEPEVKKAVAKATALDRAAAAAQKKLGALEQARDAAAKAFERAEKAPSEAFAALVSGKDPLTEYSRESAAEAFAEAFALYKVDPEGLKKTNRKLYDWFAAGGELAPARAR